MIDENPLGATLIRNLGGPTAPGELPKWEVFMGAAEASNALEMMGVSDSVGVPVPEALAELASTGVA